MNDEMNDERGINNEKERKKEMEAWVHPTTTTNSSERVRANPSPSPPSASPQAPPAAHGGVVKQSAVRRTILPVKKEWQPREAGKKQRRKPRALPGAADNLLARSKGTRVIPV